MNRSILLYVPVPPSVAFMPRILPLPARLKGRLRRNVEIASAALTGSIRFTDYVHERRLNTNRGDIAIAVAIEKQVRRSLDASDSLTVVGWGEIHAGNVASFSKAHDTLIVGGGGYIFLDSEGRLNARASDIEWLESFEGRVSAHGIGLNRLLHERPFSEFGSLPASTRQWLARFSRRMDRISVRDQPTAQLFFEGVGREVQVVGDPALCLGTAYPQPLAQAMEDRVGINVASHGRRAIHCLRRVMPVLEPLYRELSRSSMRLSYFVHEDADYSIVQYLRLRRHRFGCVDGDLEQLVRAYAECSLVVNQMLHSSILSFGSGTPAANIAYDLKAVAFYELFGLEELCIPWDQVNGENLRRVLAMMKSEQNALRQHIALRVQQMLSSQAAFVGAVLN
jgi:hypothetical protein